MASGESLAALVRRVFSLALRVPHRNRQRELRRRAHALSAQAKGERRSERLQALTARAERYMRHARGLRRLFSTQSDNAVACAARRTRAGEAA
jgi:hypothetical protein